MNAKTKPFLVTILVLPESSLMNVASVIDPLRAANRISGSELYQWRICSGDGSPPMLSCGLALPVDGQFGSNERGDFLVIIAGFRQQDHASPSLISKIAKAAGNYSLLGSVEAGTWLIARAGLARDHAVTTHWEDLELLAHDHPDLNIHHDRFVVDGRIWTSGGASPAFDMMLHLISIQNGEALALAVASVFVYDTEHVSTDAQSLISLGKLTREEPRVSNAIRLMEKHVESPLPIAAIAKKGQLTTRTLELLFTRHLSVSPGKYYLQMRLQMARKMVLDTRLSLQEIAIRCGFSSQSALSRSFKVAFGHSPIKLRSRAGMGGSAKLASNL